MSTEKIDGDWCWLEKNRVFVPDIKITVDKPENHYEALRGYAAHLAVFDLDDKCIGWIDTRTLGYDNAKAWLEACRKGEFK